MDLVWKTGDILAEDEEEVDDANEKKPPRVTEVEIDEESGEILPQKRPVHLMNSILVGFTLFLISVMLGAGFREIAIELKVDSNWIRLAFIALTPIQVFFTLVSCTRLSVRKPTNSCSSSRKSSWAALPNALDLSSR